MPLPINTSSLVDEMRQNLAEINAQIQVIREDAQDAINRNQHPGANNPYELKYTNGHYILTDLLVARSSLLAGIANLQAANTKSR